MRKKSGELLLKLSTSANVCVCARVIKNRERQTEREHW